MNSKKHTSRCVASLEFWGIIIYWLLRRVWLVRFVRHVEQEVLTKYKGILKIGKNVIDKS